MQALPKENDDNKIVIFRIKSLKLPFVQQSQLTQSLRCCIHLRRGPPRTSSQTRKMHSRCAKAWKNFASKKLGDGGDLLARSFTLSVWLYPQCVILHSVCDLGCFVKYQVCKQYIIVFVISFYHHNLSLELIEANLFCQVLLAGYDRRLQVFFISHLSNFVGNCSNVSQIFNIDLFLCVNI